MSEKISLPQWAKLHSIPLARAKKYIFELSQKNNEIEIKQTKRGIDYHIPLDIVPPQDDGITCMICGNMFQQIALKHLKSHNIETVDQYRKLYPDAPLISKEVSKKLSAAKTGHLVSQKTRDAVSRANKGNNYSVGRVLSDNTRKKISKSHIGKIVSNETREKISKAQLGVPHSEETKKKIQETHLNKTEKEKEKTVEKIKSTTLKKYGVNHVMHNSDIKSKQEKTNIERYGYKSPLLNLDIQKKITNTNFEKYGGHHTKRESERENIKNRVGNMEEVRSEFKKQYGVSNPFELSEIKERGKESMLKNYGVEHALQSEEIKQRMREERFTKTGKYWSNQENISSESLDILMNENSLAELIDNYSVIEVSKMLDIKYDLVLKYCARHSIVLPMSSYEVAILSFLKEIGIKNIICNDRKLISPKEIDFILQDEKICIEFCGLYYHSEYGMNNVGSRYHVNKLEKVLEKGYRLITIFEDEWAKKSDIVKSRLKNILGKTEKTIGARKLEIKTISNNEAQDFYDRHHIQGSSNIGFANYGAYYDGKLVSAMSFCKPRIALGRKNGAPELLRFATDGGNYPGISSRFLKRFISEYDPLEIISYADRRWSEGHLYETIGFKLDGCSAPSYSYFKRGTLEREFRFKYQKKNIKNLVENGDTKTEIEIMLELKYNRIWDCGTLRYIWRKA